MIMIVRIDTVAVGSVSADKLAFQSECVETGTRLFADVTGV